MRNSGITFSYAELTVWQDRAINGPYKTTGDRFEFSPGSWDDVVIRANRFMANPGEEYWDYVDPEFIGQYPADTYTYHKGHDIVAAAFYGLIKKNDTYRTAAKDAVLTQIANSNPVFEDYLSHSSFPNGFHFAGLTNRLFLAFDYTYDLWSETEITNYEAWMERAMTLYRHIWSPQIYLCWPNRDNDDYSEVGSWALTGEETTAQDQPYTRTDAGGTDYNYTAKYANWWMHNNRNLLFIQAETLWGLYTNNNEQIEQVKRFIREYLMFGVWADGTINESYANGGYGRVGTGNHHYSALNITAMLWVAEILRRNGDNSLYEFSTSWGIFGSEGGTKTLKLITDVHVANLRGVANHGKYFKDVTGSIGSVNELFPVEPKEPGPLNTFRHKSEMALPYGNAYWNDDLIKDTYMVQAQGCDPYFSAMGGPRYDDNADWVSLAQLEPAIPFMYYEMETLINIGKIEAKVLLI